MHHISTVLIVWKELHIPKCQDRGGKTASEERHWPVRVMLNMNKEQGITYQKGIKAQIFERLCQSCNPGNFKRERFLSYIPRNVSGGL